MKTGNPISGLLIPSIALALAVCAIGAKADYKVTVGVGHMCCGSCKKDAEESLKTLASNVSIDGKTITMTVKDNDVEPALAALRAAGFPPLHVDAGGAPVTIAVGHMCCPKCVTGLKEALLDAKIAALNTDDMTLGMGKLVVKAKEGKSLDLIEVTKAMEAGGFSATKISLGNAVAVHTIANSKRVAVNTTSKR
jgi:uncharacterized protein (UPF0212 family)